MVVIIIVVWCFVFFFWQGKKKNMKLGGDGGGEESGRIWGEERNDENILCKKFKNNKNVIKISRMCVVFTRWVTCLLVTPLCLPTFPTAPAVFNSCLHS